MAWAAFNNLKINPNKYKTRELIVDKTLIVIVIVIIVKLSGWPSDLRRQTQG